MAIDDNTIYGLTGAQIKDLPNRVEAVKGEAKILTTDDYNWPTDSPTAIADWLLDDGYYANPNGLVVYYSSSANDGNTRFLFKNTRSNGNPTVLRILDSNIYLDNHTDSAGSVVSQQMLKVSDVLDVLSSTSTTSPLSANQGRVLNEKIGDLSTLSTATKTSVVNAINDVASTASTAIQPSAIDKVVMTDLGVSADTSTTTVQLDAAKQNLRTGATSTKNITMPVASSTQAGVMNSATYDAVTENTANINALLNGAVAITGLSASPSQSDLTTAWQTATGLSTLINRAAIYDVTNDKMWTYYTNDNLWYATSSSSQVTVNTFTNDSEGVIKGSTNVGQVFAENDGTGSVNGWDTLSNTVSTHTSDISSLQSGKQNTLTAGNNISISGNTISASVPDVVQTTGNSASDVMSQSATTTAISGKQDTLVSGTNIKTINNTTLLGSGNINAINSIALAQTSTITPTNGLAQIPAASASAYGVTKKTTAVITTTYGGSSYTVDVSFSDLVQIALSGGTATIKMIDTAANDYTVIFNDTTLATASSGTGSSVWAIVFIGSPSPTSAFWPYWLELKSDGTCRWTAGDIRGGSTSAKGAVSLTDSASSASTTTAATPSAVRTAYHNGAWYATCATAAATVAKVGTCAGFSAAGGLAAGAHVTVKFTYANTAASPTLNVNSTGAKPIYVGSRAAVSGDWAAGDVKEFVYDGTNWIMTSEGVNITLSTTDIGEGATLAAGRLYGVYE